MVSSSLTEAHAVGRSSAGRVHRCCAEDGGPPARPEAPENRLQERDEEDLPGGGEPSDPSCPSSGHLDP